MKPTNIVLAGVIMAAQGSFCSTLTQPFTNGSFELPGGVAANQSLALPSGDTRLTGWTIGGSGHVTLINGTMAAFGLDFRPVDGTYQLTFNSGNTPAGTWIRQTFDTTIGGDYLLSFRVGQQSVLAGGRLSLTATVRTSDGASLGQLVAVPPGHGYGSVQRLFFTARSSTTTLTLLDTSTDTNDRDLTLDDVRVSLLSPVLTSPGTLSVSLGANVAFTFANNAASAIVYQWSFKGQPLAGETNATLVLLNVQASQAGTYAVSVASGGGIKSYGPWTLGVDPTFTKITAGAIVTEVGDSVECAWGDYDNDGFLDLIVSNAALQNEFLYHNNGNGTFAEVITGPVVSSGGDSTGVAWGDLDNNGTLDLVIVNFNNEPEFEFLNSGKGSFVRITNNAFASCAAMSSSCALVDYDRDGNLDLFVANIVTQTNFLFRGNGDGTFDRITAGTIAADKLAASILGIWGDYNNDGNPDLFVANESGYCALYRNEGEGQFTKITSGSTVNDGFGTSAAWADYDNDGFLDLVVTAATDSRLYHNDGQGSFTRASIPPPPASARTIYGCSWGDYDNDGFLDLLLIDRKGGKNVLYHGNGDGTFSVVTAGSVVNDTGHSWSAAWGDYDNDGFLDLFVSNRDGYSNFLYRNNGNSNRWLKVKLIGTRSNRSGIGAKVRVKAVIGGKETWQLREVGGGGSWGQNALDAHFGLRDATNVTALRIEWPSGIVQELKDLSPNQFIAVTEPPVLTVRSRSTIGGFELILTSRGGFNYAIDRSEDFVTWTRLGTLSNVNGSLQFVDKSASLPVQRFYRARWLP